MPNSDSIFCVSFNITASPIKNCANEAANCVTITTLDTGLKVVYENNTVSVHGNKQNVPKN
jgi:hypothetical protein